MALLASRASVVAIAYDQDTGVAKLQTAGEEDLRAPERPWKVLWCYERCYKSENDELRQCLHLAVQGYGASLVCLKKARQFCRWLDSPAPRPAFVLVVDWREAQPCMQALAHGTARTPPALTVVLCGAGQQQSRAEKWASGLGPLVGPVVVYQRNCLAPELLAGLVRHTRPLSELLATRRAAAGCAPREAAPGEPRWLALGARPRQPRPAMAAAAAAGPGAGWP